MACHDDDQRLARAYPFVSNAGKESSRIHLGLGRIRPSLLKLEIESACLGLLVHRWPTLLCRLIKASVMDSQAQL